MPNPPPSSGVPPHPDPASTEPEALPAGRIARFRASRFWRVARWPMAAGVVGLGMGIIFVAFLFATVDLPPDPPSLSSSVVLDAKGRELAVLSRGNLRVPVKLDEMSPTIPKALIAAEDRSFYEHGGVNPAGIGRALYQNLRSDNLQGGSTITQQLVKNEFLTSERSWNRKLRESVLAVKLERRSDKSEILERYLNTVYFGRGAYGIEAAARVYFDRSARDLTTPQVAFLVGVLRGSAGTDPGEHPDKAAQRRDVVLDAMVATGNLTVAEADAAKREPLTASPVKHPVTLSADVGSHFVEWIRNQLVADYGESVVYGGGLRVTTTLDLDDQRAAEAAVAGALTDPADPQAALVGVDKTGAIRAYVGGRDPAYQVDLARGAQGGGGGRQAGSTFKPFVLAAAAEKKIPLLRKWQAPATMTLPSAEGPWEVRNYNGESFGALDTVEATVHSVNTVYAQMLLDVGPAATVDVAHRAGITSDIQPNRSVVFGVDSVSPLEMAAAYLTFARDGSRVDPFAIAEVKDRDGVVLRSRPSAPDDGDPAAPRQAMEPGVAQSVNLALQQVVDHGTGTAARLDRPVAGKTGTTDQNGDAWFAGYTPEYAAVVWMGYPEGSQRRMSDVHGRAVTGGSFPAEIWHGFAAAALSDLPPTPFAPPPDEYLRGRQEPFTLNVAGPVAPGAMVTARGSGFADCFYDVHVEFTATQVKGDGPVPPALRTAVEANSVESTRQSEVALPPDAPEGTWRALAFCDTDGKGPQPVAEASFAVDDGRPDESTTTSTTRPADVVTTPTTPPSTRPTPTTATTLAATTTSPR